MRLQPLTIGHLALLYEIQSPFVTYARDVTKPDLILAVSLCAQPYFSAWASLEPLSWWERIKLEWVTWRWARAIRGFDLSAELKSFFDYLNFHRQFPDLRPQKGETRSLNSPVEWRLVGMLMEIYGMTWEAAMGTPILRAHALWATHGDREGWLELEPNDPISDLRIKELNEWARQEDAKFGHN